MQTISPTPESEAFKEHILDDWKSRSILLTIAAYYLGEKSGAPGERVGSDGGLVKYLAETFKDAKEYLSREACPVTILLSDVTGDQKSVTIKFQFKNLKGKAVITLNEADADLKYAVNVEPDTTGSSEGNDLKGPLANLAPEYTSTNPVISEKIKDGRMTELYIDPQTGELKQNYIKWIQGYTPGETRPEDYYAESVDLRQFMSDKQAKLVADWMKEHKVRGSPVRIRVVMGDIAVGWKDDVDHSNISHAGISDGVIYIGSGLLGLLFLDENEDLRKDILEDDEYAHIKGLSHGSETDIQRRLRGVAKLMEESGYMKAKKALDEKEPYAIAELLKTALTQRDKKELTRLFTIFNTIVVGNPNYPVEADYGLKQAVGLLDSNDKDELCDMLVSDDMAEIRDMIAVDDVLLELVPSATEPVVPEEKEYERMMFASSMGWIKKVRDYIKNIWVRKQCPELENKSLWQISPEIWHESGGLGRVMQYHGYGMKELLKGSNTRFRQIEPEYLHKIKYGQNGRAAKNAHDLYEYDDTDYTNKAPDGKRHTHPITSEIENVAEFTVMVGDKEVKAIATKGYNDLGVEVFMIRDEAGYYTHSIYNYRKMENNDPNLPTWEEFACFFSKASMELVKIVEAREKETIERDGGKWEAPVIHTNDSQTAMVSVYRKIQLEEAKKKKAQDPSFLIDPVLADSTIFFTSHTYGNRQDYSNSDGEAVLKFLGVPREYFELFQYSNGNRYDLASGGFRSSDGQGVVSYAQWLDKHSQDDWVGDPGDKNLINFYREFMGVEVNIKAIANGDHRENTRKYFVKYFKEAFGQFADAEHPTPEQVNTVKEIAKERLTIDPSKYFSTKDKPSAGQPLLDKNKIVISYSGRLVSVKAGRGRNGGGKDGRGAFDNENIKKLLREGAQIVHYGNIQPYGSSEWMAEQMIELINEIKGKPEYTGTLIYVPRFTLDEQRALLAATDIQVQDSDPETEAAGFTESDISACGGIQVGTRRSDPKNKGIGEGLFQQQGYPMDFTKTGVGSTCTPKENTADSYYNDCFVPLLKEYNKKTLKYYQATSVRLSRCLSALNTAAAYLRAFSKTVEKKKKMQANSEAHRKMREKEAAKNETLADQIYKREAEMSQKGLTVYTVLEALADGDAAKAVKTLFNTPGFQGDVKRLSTVADMYNGILDLVIKGKMKKDIVRDFVTQVNAAIVEYSEPAKEDEAVRFMGKEARETQKTIVADAVQIMGGQALTIIYWTETGNVPGAGNIRLTADPKEMARSDKGGTYSYIKFATLPRSIQIAKAGLLGDEDVLLGSSNTENNPGFFWRGVEKVKKLLTVNILPSLIRNSKLWAAAKENLVLYLMDHGFMSVPEGLMEDSKKNKISTIHETFFLNDLLPGTLQTTSTGPGHFQGLDMDIKHVVEGRGAQVNVKYSLAGEIEKVIVQEVKAGDRCVAIPGFVDYMINLGGLRFNDFRYTFSYEEAKEAFKRDKFQKEFYDFLPDMSVYSGKDDVKAHEKALKDKIKWQPFLGVKDLDGTAALKKYFSGMDLTDSQCVFAKLPEGNFFDSDTLLGFYGKENRVMDDVRAMVTGMVSDLGRMTIPGPSKLIDDGALSAQLEGEKGEEAVDVQKTVAIQEYIEDNEAFAAELFARGTVTDKLIRISVETLQAFSFENIEVVEGFLKALSSKEHIFIELYSIGSISPVDEHYYKKYGITKNIPADFERNRTNTITILPVDKTDEFSASGKILRRKSEAGTGGSEYDLGNMFEDPDKTIITPIGLNFDKAGLIRSLFLGLRLSAIASDPSIEEEKNNDFLRATLAEYKRYCGSVGIDTLKIKLTAGDLINLARGDLSLMAQALNKMIKLLPIVPLNTEEIRVIYEKAREVLTKA
ncbi:MAG: glycogen/starch synthase [Candidatus Omnitrophica bacterium]|nr:glycogen/starch synthase [Candidatus Omnitrophota bacterium]